MSGLNPFRLRKSKDTAGETSTPPSRPTSFISPVPPSSPTAVAAPIPNRPVTSIPDPSIETPQTPLPLNTNGDDPTSSNDQFFPNPFNADSFLSDNDAQENNGDGPIWSASRSIPEDDRRLTSVGVTPHTAPSSDNNINTSSPSTTSAPSSISGKTEQTVTDIRDNNVLSRDTTDGLRQPHPSPYYPGLHSARSSSTDVSQRSVSDSRSTLTLPVHRPIPDRSPSEVDDDSKILVSRSGNREKKPPPPPKSHHGRRISFTPTATSSIGQSKPADSLHSNGSTPLYTPAFTSSLSRASQLATDYFSSRPGNHVTQQTEPLRRSQSQLKRPPTPPLSRRHSQMRRSKSTATKRNPGRLSMPPGSLEFDESNLPSPGRRSLNLPRHREIESRTPEDDPGFKLPSQGQSTITQTKETPSQAPASVTRMSSTRSAKRNSLTPSGMPPPPPPPRRGKGVSNSDSNAPSQSNIPQPEKKVEPDESFFPHPSNANDILADLSRLQKEVDALRGHYESHRVSR